jgi:CHAD domain-containing protein
VAASKGPGAGSGSVAKIGHSAPASLLVGRRLQWLADELALRQAEVKGGKGAAGSIRPDEAVHRMRVAIRRLRASLRTFGSLLEPATTAGLEPELAWLARMLGPVRDQEVLLDRLRPQLAIPVRSDLPPAVYESLEKRLGAHITVARQEALAGLGSDRYARLAEHLAKVAASPPWTAPASLPGPDVLPALVRRDHRRLAHRVDWALAAPVGGDRDQGFHSARKAAKRARYGAETLEPAWGEPARRYIRALVTVQDILGERQDAVVARGFLRQEAAGAAGVDAFAYGTLAGLQQAAVQEADRVLPKAWRKAQQRQPSRWV